MNLDDANCAITHNYVSPSNLGNVLKFFVEKQDQISGCRDRADSIKPEHLHKALVTALATVEPKVLQKAEMQKEWSCRAWIDKSKCNENKMSDLKKVHDGMSNMESSTSVMARTEKIQSFSFSFL